MTIIVIGTPARSKIEELACEPGDGDIAGIVIFKFDEATLAAAIAERFPLSRAHFVEALRLPERLAGRIPWNLLGGTPF